VRKTDTMVGSSTSHKKGRLFTPLPAVSQLLPVLQIHFRSHANICTHFISLLDEHFKTFWTVPCTFPSTSGSRILLPVQHPRDWKWNANKSVSLAPAIISLQCSLRASSRDFPPTMSKMAAKTTSGSGSDHKFGLVAPGF